MIYEATEISGSDEYLAHHGILGQKWGVRRFQNPDGTLTAEGKARYFSKRETGKFARKVKRYSDNPNNSDFDRISKAPQIKAIASKLKKSWDTLGAVEKNVGSKLRKTEKDYFGRKDHDKWAAKAARKYWEEELDEQTKSVFPLKEYIATWIHDDDDQGKRENMPTSFDMWLNESGTREAKEYLKNEKKLREAQLNYRSECKNAVREFLGKHGDKPAGYTINFEDGKFLLRQRTLTEKGADLVSDVLSRSGDMSELKQLELAEELYGD